MDWLDLLAVQGTFKSFLQHHSSRPSVLQCSVRKGTPLASRVAQGRGNSRKNKNIPLVSGATGTLNCCAPCTSPVALGEPRPHARFQERLWLLPPVQTRGQYIRPTDPIDGSPSGSPVPGILQARTLEWLAISFSISNCQALGQPLEAA